MDRSCWVGVFRKALYALLLAAISLLVYSPTAKADTWPGWATCPVVGYQIAGHPTLPQFVAIQRAVLQASIASGQWYQYDGYTTWLPQLGQIDTAPDELVIAVVNRQQSDLLQVDGTADDGYTWWTPNGHAAIALLDSMQGVTDYGPSQIDALTLHELMLSRHIPEGLDPGGVLGHIVPNTMFYSPADIAMMKGCAA